MRDMYDLQEHVEFFESVRNGKAHNDDGAGWRIVPSWPSGRMAAYSGKKITWKQLMELHEDLAPEETFQWDSSFKPHDLPVPGQYKLV